MQKKIIICIIGYIIIMCVVGGGLFIKRQLDNIPVVDDALIQELLDSSELGKVEPGEKSESPQVSKGESTETEGNESNYWGNYYQETKPGEAGRSPIIPQIQERITVGDKLKIIKIIKKNLSSEDIKYILSLSKSGFSSTEQTNVKSLLREKMGEEEKQELKELLLKYL